jgi:hypothetical protein
MSTNPAEDVIQRVMTPVPGREIHLPGNGVDGNSDQPALATAARMRLGHSLFPLERGGAFGMRGVEQGEQCFGRKTVIEIGLQFACLRGV